MLAPPVRPHHSFQQCPPDKGPEPVSPPRCVCASRKCQGWARVPAAGAYSAGGRNVLESSECRQSLPSEAARKGRKIRMDHAVLFLASRGRPAGTHTDAFISRAGRGGVVPEVRRAQGKGLRAPDVAITPRSSIWNGLFSLGGTSLAEKNQVCGCNRKEPVSHRQPFVATAQCTRPG